jgi:hypothetical protein
MFATHPLLAPRSALLVVEDVGLALDQHLVAGRGVDRDPS